MELDKIKARHKKAQKAYDSFNAFHKARKHSNATLEQAHEFSLHCDIDFLLKLIEKGEGKC